MRLMLETSQVKFTVSKEPEPKIDNQTGAQKHDRQTNAPLVVTELVTHEQGHGADQGDHGGRAAQGDRGSAGELPRVADAAVGSERPLTGVAFRAESIEPVPVGKSTTAAAAPGASS